MPAPRVPIIVGVLAASSFCPARGSAQEELRSPLPYIAAPAPNVGSQAAAPPIVEQPPSRFRSGPPRIACWAIPSITKGQCGYYIGGGSGHCFGQPRFVTEGTWGWDFRGRCLPQRVLLQWWHGRCYQGGAGAYRIDGPPLLKLLEQHKSEHEPP